jgi:hypothetical protein
MDRIEYYDVFASLFYALVIAEILIGWNRMIAVRKTIKLYWAHVCFTVLYLFMLMADYSWTFYTGVYNLVDSVFTFFLFVAIKPATYFFAAYQAFPKDPEGVDFKEFFKLKRKEILFPVGVLQCIIVFKSASSVVSARGLDYLFSEYLFSGKALVEIWLQALFIPLIFFVVFHKKLWSAEVLVIFGLIVQSYFNIIKFKTPW